MRLRLIGPIVVIALLGACASGDQSTERALPPSGSELEEERGDANPGSKANSNGGSAAQAPTDPAPDFTVDTFDGDIFALAEQKGTPVVLNFWESW